ncbi:MAG: TadE family protein [Alphaproteobacteria bacterium]
MAVEFAFMAPLFAIMALGAFDFGRYGLGLMRVSSAARAGVQYGTLDHSTANDLTNMVQRARDDALDSSNTLDVSARQFYRCPSGVEIGGASLCPDGAYPPLYVEVTVADTLELLFDYPGVPDSITLAAVTRMRVR